MQSIAFAYQKVLLIFGSYCRAVSTISVFLLCSLSCLSKSRIRDRAAILCTTLPVETALNSEVNTTSLVPVDAFNTTCAGTCWIGSESTP